MKILTFADTHGDVHLFKKLLQRSQKPDIDLVALAGDITQLQHNLSYFLKKLDTLNKPVFLIPGNHETSAALDKEIKKLKNTINLHKKSHSFQNYLFLGYGEGGFALEDQEFRSLARRWLNLKHQKIILLIHGPPYKTKLDKINGQHTGNKDIRNFIEKKQPLLVICGHLHENEGQTDKIKKTQIINPGWRGMIIEI